jgi:bifunctional non-homologous end joining protein LigD
VSTSSRVNIRFPKASQKFTEYYKPMLATLVDKAFNDKGWIYEIKWDGYRAVAEWQNKKLRLYSRNGLSFAEKFPLVADAVKQISHDAILDGEIVVHDENGNPSFQKLQHYEDNTDLPIKYYVFDILFLNKKDLRDLPLLKRKELLQDLLSKTKNDIIQYCDHIHEHGIQFFKLAKEKNLEGIIAKNAQSLYLCGARSKEWLKIKNHNSREAIIVGYTEPRNSRKYFGALVLAQFDGDKLKYMGHTGTGFDEAGLKELWNKMQPLIVSKSPFQEKVKVNMPVTWIKPKLVCEISFTEETEEGSLRHPVYMGLRIDKKYTEVKKINETPKHIKTTASKNRAVENENEADHEIVETEEPANPKNKEVIIDKHNLVLSNYSKIFWPDEKYTKGDMIEYYQKIAPYIIPYLKNRPLSLKRNPNGILEEGFFHKDSGVHAPSWIKQQDVFSESTNKTIHYIMVNDAATLVYVANLGCIEMNPWNSALPKIDNPTYMVIDIDPSDKNTFDEVIEVAQVVKAVLDNAGCACYCKTSGATGLHVYVPMGAKYTYDQVKNFGHIVASMVQAQLPSNTSLERSLAKRGDKIYIDFLQNRKGQTLACPYSLRPKKGATVSTPLEWDEVKTGLHPSNFNIKNIFERLAKKKDLFAPVLGKGIDLKKCLEKLS